MLRDTVCLNRDNTLAHLPALCRNQIERVARAEVSLNDTLEEVKSEGKQLVTWSADVDTNDWWRGSTPEAIVQRAMRRLNANGRGIILMHDIHRATAMALPILLKELKANGYNVVQVVAAGERPKSIHELMASPAADGKALPTELTNASNGDHTLATRQNHRIKKRSASRHHPAQSWFQADQVITTKRPFWVFSGY